MLERFQDGNVAAKTILHPWQLLLMCLVNFLLCFLLDGQGTVISVQFQRRKCLEKCVNYTGINRVTGDLLTIRRLVLLPQVVAQISAATFVLNHHLVATFTTVNEPLQ